MPGHTRPPRRRKDTYWWRTRLALNCLAFVTPVLLAYHVAAAYFGTDPRALRHVGRILRYFGATAPYLPPVVVAAALLLQHAAQKAPWKLHGMTVAGMLAESVAWMAPLAVMSMLFGGVLADGLSATQPETRAAAEVVLPGVGAAVYEEFLFRMLFISLVVGVFHHVLDLPRGAVTVVAIVAGAALFAFYHFLGRELAWESFPWREFCFLLAAGGYLGSVYVGRGFGIAVGAHALYNVFVVLRGT